MIALLPILRAREKMRRTKMNKCVFIGNLTKDVELTNTPNSTAVAKFTIAVSRRFANANGEKETDFINIVAWRGVADTCAKYLKKGSKVCVTGALQARTYDAQDGTKRYVSEIVADEVEFLSTKAESGEKANEPKMAPIDDDDLPF